MKSNVSGILGGIIGGLVKLGLDQITYTIGISTVDTVGTFSGIFFGGPQYFAVWIIYLIGSGLIGWLAALLIPAKYSKSYITTGIIVGIIIWGGMNVIFAAADIATPTWAMGIGSFITNLVTHIVLGIIITYTVWAYGSRKVSSQNFNKVNFNTETASEINPYSDKSNSNQNSINNTNRDNKS